MSITLDYDDRFLLAMESLRVRYERRGNFLSDSDLLDTADLFTTDRRDLDGMFPENGDRDLLLGHLFATVFPPEG